MTEFMLRQKAEYERMTRGLPEHVKRIVTDKVENHIRERPYDEEELQYELSGLWSYNKLEPGSRIIYAICEDCRKKKLTMLNGCGDCHEIPNNTIMLWAFGTHSIYDQLRMMRRKVWHKVVKQKRRERKY